MCGSFFKMSDNYIGWPYLMISAFNEVATRNREWKGERKKEWREKRLWPLLLIATQFEVLRTCHFITAELNLQILTVELDKYQARQHQWVHILKIFRRISYYAIIKRRLHAWNDLLNVYNVIFRLRNARVVQAFAQITYYTLSSFSDSTLPSLSLSLPHSFIHSLLCYYLIERT